MALVLSTLSYYRGGKTVSETDSSRISSVLGYLRVYNGIITYFNLFLVSKLVYLTNQKQVALEFLFI